MGLFDQFPYTNFHNLNLDWIIGQIKSIKSDVTSTAEDAASASHSAEAAAASAGSAAGSAAYAGNAAALVQQVRDDLDTVNTEMTNFIQAHSGLYNETVLWSGTASATGDTITLSDDIRNYKYIDVQATYKGAVSASAFGTFSSNVVRFTPKMFTDDNAVLNIPYAYNDQLQICTVFMFWDSLDPTDYTKISLGYSRRVSINDHGDLDNAADPGTVIVKIVGVKNIADAEVIDARVGEDDTVYSTLKQRLDTEYSDLKSAITDGVNLKASISTALLNLLDKMVVNVTGGRELYNALSDALLGSLTSITAVYTQSGVVYDNASLDSLKSDLVVTAHYDDSSSKVVNGYILNGTLTEGVSTITVEYGGKTTTFTVNVTLSRATRFGTFTGLYSCGKKINSTTYGNHPMYATWNNSASARATITTPIANRNYVITATDSSKYNVIVYGLTSNTAYASTYSGAVTGEYYQGDTLTPSWDASSASTAPYIFIALKKMDNTNFTEEELANGAEAVFTFTESA